MPNVARRFGPVLIAWYLLYAALAVYAPGFAGTKVLGVLQFALTAVITIACLRSARRRIANR